jgi:hypothetical protein
MIIKRIETEQDAVDVLESMAVGESVSIDKGGAPKWNHIDRIAKHCYVWSRFLQEHIGQNFKIGDKILSDDDARDTLFYFRGTYNETYGFPVFLKKYVEKTTN